MLGVEQKYFSGLSQQNLSAELKQPISADLEATNSYIKQDNSCRTTDNKKSIATRKVLSKADICANKIILSSMRNAIFIGDINVLDNLLIKHPGLINEVNDFGGGLLFSAIACGNQDIVKLLLEHGADTNEVDKTGYTPLSKLLEERYSQKKMFAGASSSRERTVNKEIIKALLMYNADPNYLDANGTTPLIKAIEHDDHDIILLLLEHNADPNKTGIDKETPLFKATKNLDAKAISYLLEYHADPNWETVSGTTPLLEAVSYGAHRIELLLLDHYRTNPNQADNKGITPLLEAIENDNLKSIRYLLEAYADPNKADNNGITPLLKAIENGQTNIVEILLKNGANPNHRNMDGNTALAAAIESATAEEVSKLLEYGASPNRYMLSLAVTNCPEVVGLLLKQGADVRSLYDYDWFMQLAIDKCDTDTVITLLRANDKADCSYLLNLGLKHCPLSCVKEFKDSFNGNYQTPFIELAKNKCSVKVAVKLSKYITCALEMEKAKNSTSLYESCVII